MVDEPRLFWIIPHNSSAQAVFSWLVEYPNKSSISLTAVNSYSLCSSHHDTSFSSATEIGELKNRFGLKQQQKIDTLHSIEKFLNRVIYWDLLSVNLFLHDNLDISHELEKNIAVLDMWSQYF